ncbi:MAG: site-specific integrase [Bacteroides sp.]|nr:site-specific integrase [Bacteroides sp.]
MHLVLRLSSRGFDHPGSLCLRLIHNRRVKSVTLPGCRLYAREWNKALQVITYPDNASQRSLYLEKIESKITHETEIMNRFIQQLQNKGYYTVDELVSLYKEKKDEGKLLGYAESLAKELERNHQYRTANAYRTVVRGLIKFNKGVDIPLHHLNSCLMRSFEKHLKESGKLSNTVAYYFRNLRAIYNKAVKSNRIVVRRSENPFAGISTAVTRTMKRALTLEELQALLQIDFKEQLHSVTPGSREYDRIKNMYRSWSYFFFCFYVRGMSFIDLAYLKKENIRGGVIRYCRKKTGQQIEITLTAELREIIESFTAEVAGSVYLFPIISSTHKNAQLQYETALRTQNMRLKSLAEWASIKRPVSTYVARHSWATVGKQENVPIQVISECLGHTSPDTTLIYLALLNNRILDDANERVTRALRGFSLD